jgi:hypothetical protein
MPAPIAEICLQADRVVVESLEMHDVLILNASALASAVELCSVVDSFDIDFDASTARQAAAPRNFVGHSELEQFSDAAFDDLQAFSDDVAFDASAGHRAGEITVCIERQA